MDGLVVRVLLHVARRAVAVEHGAIGMPLGGHTQRLCVARQRLHVLTLAEVDVALVLELEGALQEHLHDVFAMDGLLSRSLRGPVVHPWTTIRTQPHHSHPTAALEKPLDRRATSTWLAETLSVKQRLPALALRNGGWGVRVDGRTSSSVLAASGSLLLALVLPPISAELGRLLIMHRRAQHT